MRQMFLARPPLEFKPPVARKKPTKITGISQLLGSFETTPAPPPAPFELPAERRKRIREHMKKLHDEKNELLVADWDPHNNPHSTE
jgi:U1 small nuclear ribonucleoprotein